MTDSNKPFDFWNDHSLEFLEMSMKRDCQERVASCDGYGSQTRECGDTIEFFLNAKQGILDTISYDLKGCIFSHACVNTIIKLAAKQPVQKAKKITEQDIIRFLKTLPEQEEHCAAHCLKAFRMALEDLDTRHRP